jgi:hypothetical protein
MDRPACTRGYVEGHTGTRGRCVLLGETATEGMECMDGSAMYLMTTGKPQSHTRTVLSSEVEIKRRFSSTNVMLLTAPRCWSYSCTIAPELTSHCADPYRCPQRSVMPHKAMRYRTDPKRTHTRTERERERAHLYNLFVGAASQELVLFVGVWVKLDAVWNALVRKRRYALACAAPPPRHHTASASRAPHAPPSTTTGTRPIAADRSALRPIPPIVPTTPAVYVWARDTGGRTPVSVSHNLMVLSKLAERKRAPSLVKQISRTPLLCPM